MLHLIEHPLVADRLTRLRDAQCSPGEFRLLVDQVARLLVPAVTADLETDPAPVETPLEPADGQTLRRPIVLVPILRAGLGLSEGFLSLLPEARVAHIGLCRDETTLQPATYYFNAPVDLAEVEVMVLDPMLATGGSAVDAIGKLKDNGSTHLRFVCLVASPEGVARLETDHPEVPIYAAALDRQLDDRGFIRPGLGDAGDRIFGTV